MKKRFVSFFFAFLLLFSFPLHFIVSAVELPPLPQFIISDTGNINTTNTNTQFAHLLFYRPSVNQYAYYTFITPTEYLNQGYIDIIFDSSTGFYRISSQPHLSSNSTIRTAYCRSNNGVATFTNYMNNIYSTIGFDSNSISIISIPNTEVVSEWADQAVLIASDINISYEGNIVYYGNYDSFCTLFDSSNLPVHNSYASPVQPPTQPPTLSPEQVQQEQVTASKSILENVKTILTNIVNLPSNIASHIRSFFVDLLAGIVSVGESIVNGILDALKYLFIPSGTVFSNIQTAIEDKFAFIYQIIDLGIDIVNCTFSDDAPEFILELDDGTILSLVDWELFDEYRTFIHGLIIAIAYAVYMPKVLKRLPSIIRGI